MKSNYSNLMQSKYFSPVFNSAIFDGPLRIYFAQFHEAFALKVYFMLQSSFQSQLVRAKEISRSSHTSIFIMIYPSEDHFTLSFDSDESTQGPTVLEAWNNDRVIGLKQPMEDQQMDLLMNHFNQALGLWFDLNDSKTMPLTL